MALYNSASLGMTAKDALVSEPSLVCLEAGEREALTECEDKVQACRLVIAWHV